MIARITDGLGQRIEITYDSTVDGAAGTYLNVPPPLPIECPGPAACALDYPRASPSSGHIVSSVAHDDGVGGQYTLDYFYTGARRDLRHRRFVGFESIAVVDSRNSRKLERHFLQEYPFSGREWRRSTYLASGIQVREELRTWAARSYGGDHSFVYLDDSTVVEMELDGSTIRTVETDLEFDDYGNEIVRNVDSSIRQGG